ncbi:MAG: IS630 family transposase [Fischerella sp.]|nr:IS630 family transposase [Fischerella sp.]
MSPPEPGQRTNYQAKRLDWEMLKLWALLGTICLKYLDESGCDCQRSTNYCYGKRGQQKKVAQYKRRGRRINIFGVWQPQQQFDYALMVGSLRTETFLELMDWQAAKATNLFEKTGQLTVIVLDNSSVHKSQLVSQRLDRWQHQGLLLFFLPPYSPQMNRIEDEWLHLKRDELAGRVFEDEYDLSIAIRNGIEARANRGNYDVERFIFN